MRYIKYLFNPIALLKKCKQKLSKKNSEWVKAYDQNPYLEFRAICNSEVTAGTDWDKLLIKVIKEVNDDPVSFLREPTISYTLHPNQSELAKLYFDELSTEPYVLKKLLPKLHDVPMGDPYLCEFFPLASPLTIQHVYYLYLMKIKFNFFVPEERISNIVEIGGGYGNFCRLIKNYGYEGKYTIIDLPSMSDIQKHYLSHVLAVNDFDSIEFCELDTENIRSNIKNNTSMLVGTFSINEMPLDTRDEISATYKEFEYMFFAYDLYFCGVDNREYFTSLVKILEDDFYIYHEKDKHRRTWFLLCCNKNQVDIKDHHTQKY